MAVLGFAGRRKADDADRRKLRAHINVLRLRAQRLIAGKKPDESNDGALVLKLLQEEPQYDDLETAHEYADRLEELVPLVADSAYLRAVLAYELIGGDPDEPVKVSSVVGDAALQRLRAADDGTPASSDADFPVREVAQSLSLLYRVRADHLRHERLMAKLRGAYLPYLGQLIVGLLCVLAIAVLLKGLVDGGGWGSAIQVAVVAAAGGLGGVLAATFRLRDTVALNPLRGVLAITYIQPLVGASFGLVSWLVLTSGLLTIASADNQAWQLQAVVAFASGFSEPLFLNIVGRVLVPQR